jgi:2-polyprenyl-6-methoxyphenol hydroxylase-like FAD-dependent oxidoreductase
MKNNLIQSSGLRQVIIVGGGIAGLLSARVLSRYFDQVTVIEQDDKESVHRLDSRKGVPHALHSHFLMLKGMTIIRQLFPTIDQELSKRGAKEIDVYRDIQLYRGAWLPNFESGKSTFLQTRPLLEEAIRSLVEPYPNIQFQYGEKIEGLLTNEAQTRLVGVYSLNKNSPEPHRFFGDLIVDAMGRNTLFPSWIHSLGYPSLPKTEVYNDIYYCSRIYETPKDLTINWVCKNIRQTIPFKKKAGVVMEVEGNGEARQWLVTLVGQLGDYPDNSEDGFIEFASQLEQPDIYDFIKQAKAVTPISSFRSPSSFHYQYEKSSRLPDGFIAIGDSFYTLNPVFGQGMSACAIAIHALDQCLEKFGGTSQKLQCHYFKDTAHLLNIPWKQTLNQDLLYPEIKGKRPFGFKLLSWYKGKLLQLCQDPVVGKTIYQVINLEKPSKSLFRPSMILKVFGLASRQIYQKILNKE